MSILITGCEGFLGSRLAQSLHGNGAQVVGLDVAAGAKRPWPVNFGRRYRPVAHRPAVRGAPS